MTTESPQPTPYVFLSYASADRERALKIATQLEAQGVAVWIDRKSIAGGTSWSAEIVRGIEECAVLLMLGSKAAMESLNVQQELQLAWEHRRPILPLLLDKTPLPRAVEYVLAGRQWIEVHDRADDAWLAEALRALAGLGVPPRTAPGPNPPRSDVLEIISSEPTRILRLGDRPPRHNLPVELTSFVGREKELTEIRRPLRNGRLVTLTGTGGCGKTRLAMRIGHELVDAFRDGVWLVELAPLSDPSLVPQTVLAALGVPEVPGQAATATLVTFLRTRPILLILDNCEHLVDACARLAETPLRACPDVRILATSRELLGLTGELAWHVPSLSAPSDTVRPTAAALSGSEAVQLFVERAVAVSPGFALTDDNAPACAQIVRRLDGIPLAIELAAARVRVLTVEQIVARLDDRFRLLTGGSRTALRRQQTLQATIDWSYLLLAEAERALLRRLTVFVGGWALEAAEAVGAGDGIEASEVLDLLTNLIDKSLVITEELNGVERFQLLETIRQYGRERLATGGEAAAIQGRHAAYFLALAEQAEAGLRGPQMATWIVRLTADWANLRAALRWSVESGEAERALQASGALRWFWYYFGYPTEAHAWLGELLRMPAAQARSAGRAWALIAAGLVAWNRYDASDARASFEEAREIARTLGDRQAMSECVIGLGLVAVQEGDGAAGRGLLEEGLAAARETDRPWSIALAHHYLGQGAFVQGDLAQARAALERSVELFNGLGHKQGMASTLNWLGHVATAQGEYAIARSMYRESLALRRQVPYPVGVAFTLGGFANLAAALSEHDRAARLAGAAAAICETYGLPSIRVQNAGIAERLSASRASIGVAAYEAAFADGQGMTLEQAIVCALEDNKKNLS